MISRLLAWMEGKNAEVRLPWRMFWTGFAIRVLFITFGHSYRFSGIQDHFQFGWEMGRIARAVATGRGFSDPFVTSSGPTAWCPPLYPLMMAGVFKIFGIYSALSGWVILTINSIFSALTAVAVYEIGKRSFRGKVALWSGWIWALYPAAMQYAVHWIWETAISTSLLAVVIAVALRVRGVGEASQPSDQKRTALWAAFGLLWGLIGLLNPSLMVFLPACGLWMLWGEWHDILANVARVTLAAVLCAACLAPWIWRNWVAFHAFIPMRSNFGAELYASSLETNDGFPWGGTISIFAATPDQRRYRELGEVAFSKERGEMAKAIFRANPGRFERYALKRVYFFWVSVPHPIDGKLMTEVFRELNYSFLSLSGLLGLGLAIRRRQPGAPLYASAFLLVPIVYYGVTVWARMRSPLEPLICVLGVYLFQSADRSRVWSWRE
ncbi:MAG TPA: glycosyltransferase family 39 protein [Edaphobacter sp.]|nr:glycosyltransferase family 39 protein [Edaphobacter sp.]